MPEVNWDDPKNQIIALLVILLILVIFLFRQSNKGSNFLKEKDCFEMCRNEGQKCLDTCFDMVEDQYGTGW
ncbi:MAG: hypothetical protein A2844_01085 [Candidatus Ryanbacteria bacterium RIFCSPHIGHO2_01_FULL_48_80]|nr:MAG: hypothetical protein A2844_01085 [Candidatus Ryanbacteria bacterium RIFCSPHIGHO2_01_FULL_48_80]